MKGEREGERERREEREIQQAPLALCPPQAGGWGGAPTLGREQCARPSLRKTLSRMCRTRGGKKGIIGRDVSHIEQYGKAAPLGRHESPSSPSKHALMRTPDTNSYAGNLQVRRNPNALGEARRCATALASTSCEMVAIAGAEQPDRSPRSPTVS